MSLIECDIDGSEAAAFVDSNTSTQRCHYYDAEVWGAGAAVATEPKAFKSNRKQQRSHTSTMKRKDKSRGCSSTKHGVSIEECVDAYIEKLDKY